MTKSRPGGRGQSEVLGLVGLFAIVLVVSGTVVLIGGQAIEDATSDVSLESASTTMLELQSAAARPSSGSSERISFAQTGNGGDVHAGDAGVRIQESDSVAVEPNAGTIHVTIDDTDRGTLSRTITMGRVTYEDSDDTLAYQGGAVFRHTRGSESSAIVSPPTFEYRYRGGVPTLSLDVTRIAAAPSRGIDGNSFTVRRTGSDDVYPDRSPGPSDPLVPLRGTDSVTVTVTSEYYRAWSEFFAQRTRASPTYDHSNDQVTITLGGTTTSAPDVDGAFAARNPGCCNELRLDHKTSVVDYDSTGSAAGGGRGTTYVSGVLDWASGASAGMGDIDGDLVVEERIEARSNANSNQIGIGGKTVVGGHPSDPNPTTIECKGCEFGAGLPADADALHVGGDLELIGHNAADAVIHGDVYVGGDVLALENVRIEGDLHVMGDLRADGSGVTVDDVYVGGSVTGSGWSSEYDPATPPDEPESPDFPSPDPVSDEIDARESDWAGGNNDNDEMVQGDVQDIETANGCDPCELTSGRYYVDGTMTVGSGDEIVFDTTGGPIEIYVDGVEFEGGTVRVVGEHPVRVYNDGNFNFDGGEIRTTHETNYAPAFWVYMHPDQGGTIGADGFTGVIYAPGNGNGVLNINGQHNDIYGAIIGEMNPNVPKHTTFHFDEALLDASFDEPVGRSRGEVVGWVRVGTRTIEVTDD